VAEGTAGASVIAEKRLSRSFSIAPEELGAERSDYRERLLKRASAAVRARTNPSAPPGSPVTGGKQSPPGQTRRVNPD